jgi:DNA-binding MarR family transcriptional regulator
MFLWGGDGLSQAELARIVAIEPPTIVRTIDRMVRDGPELPSSSSIRLVNTPLSCPS